MNARAPLAVIGGGRMGEAIIAGLLSSGALVPSDIHVAEPDAGRRQALTSSHGVECFTDGTAAVQRAATVLLAVKPQVIDEVASSLAARVPAGAVVVSIAAGVACARLEALLPPGTSVVRVMPNTPALVGEGIAVVSGGAAATEDEVEGVRALFGAVGEAVVLEERHQNAATAISGSGPAYFAVFVDALARAGEREGLSRDVAKRLAVSTMRGTAVLLESTGWEPDELVRAVASPGGTTVAALGRLESAGFAAAVDDAVSAAVERAKELGS
jgi:pyrroline-5-carboxylate reductase